MLRSREILDVTQNRATRRKKFLRGDYSERKRAAVIQQMVGMVKMPSTA
jgi:hypothetical protein